MDFNDIITGITWESIGKAWIIVVGAGAVMHIVERAYSLLFKKK